MDGRANTPVSEVLLNAEHQIRRASDIRKRAMDLLVQAARVQEEAYQELIDLLGEEDGGYTYRLACRSVGVDPSARLDGKSTSTPEISISAAQAPKPSVEDRSLETSKHLHNDVPEPLITVPPVMEVTPQRPAPPSLLVNEPNRSREQDNQFSLDPTKVELYGVAIKRSKAAEAEEVINLALKAVSQNRKHNPFADDRGRNAWRNTLFLAVLSSDTSRQDEIGVDSDETLELDEPVDNDLEDKPIQLAPAARAGAVDSPPARNDIDVLDDEPVIPSRSVPFTKNPAQVVPTATEPREKEKDVPKFLRTTPPLHVPTTVHNRTHAFGQAVPEPAGLKDTLAKINSGKLQQPSAPVTAPKPTTSRPAPGFLKNK